AIVSNRDMMKYAISNNSRALHRLLHFGPPKHQRVEMAISSDVNRGHISANHTFEGNLVLLAEDDSVGCCFEPKLEGERTVSRSCGGHGEKVRRQAEKIVAAT